jgi:hypothetical protein
MATSIEVRLRDLLLQPEPTMFEEPVPAIEALRVEEGKR